MSAEQFWYHGVSGIVQFDLACTSSAGLTLSLHNSLFFDSGDRPNLATPAVIGFRREYHVPLYYAADLALWAVYFASKQPFGWFVRGGLAITYAHADPVTRTEWIEPQSSLKSINLDKPATDCARFSYALGLGYSIKLATLLSITPELRIWKTIDPTLQRSPFAFRIQLAI